MNIFELAQKLQGQQTITTIMKTAGVNRQKANYYVHKLRQKNYVKTKRLKNNNRLYSISFENRIGGVSYQEILNRHSSIKLAISNVHKIHGKEPFPEDVLIFALKSNSLRTLLASLSLFRKIHNWSYLYQKAKKEGITREVGALYDIARTVMKTRKITKRYLNNSLPKKEKTKYIIKGLKSNDFQAIEKKWKVYLPFNKKDLEVYK